MAYFEGSIFSWQLKRYTSLRVTIPQRRSDKEQKILYLLHGLCDDSSMWIRHTRIDSYAAERNFVVIMPDAERSFYTDIENGGKYFSYINLELPRLCEQLFGLKHTQHNTFIAGSSMGGYGALKSALRTPQQYAACASFSGVLDMKSRIKHPDAEQVFPEVSHIFGNKRTLKNRDDIFELSKQISCLPYSEKPNILLTCGLSDEYLQDSRDFEKHLQLTNYGKYIMNEWEGGHDWNFWDSSIKRALDFFMG